MDASTGVRLKKMVDPCKECGTDYIFSDSDMDGFIEQINRLNAWDGWRSWITGVITGFLAASAIWFIWG